jgi:hypothetical protein
VNTEVNVNVAQCFPKCGTRTTSGTRKDFKGYAAENKLLKIVPEFSMLSDELYYKENKQIR